MSVSLDRQAYDWMKKNKTHFTFKICTAESLMNADTIHLQHFYVQATWTIRNFKHGSAVAYALGKQLKH